jgi:hypothetical protein
MGVGLYKECPYGWAECRDQLEIVVVWGLACSGALVQPKLGWVFLYKHVSDKMFFKTFCQNCKNLDS